MCSFGSCQTRFEFLSQFRKVRNAFECFITQVQTYLPKTKRVWPMKINVICTVIFSSYLYSQNNQSNILSNRRSPNSGAGLRVRSLNTTSGTEVLSTLPKGGTALEEPPTGLHVLPPHWQGYY